MKNLQIINKSKMKKHQTLKKNNWQDARSKLNSNLQNGLKVAF